MMRCQLLLDNQLSLADFVVPSLISLGDNLQPLNRSLCKNLTELKQFQPESQENISAFRSSISYFPISRSSIDSELKVKLNTLEIPKKKFDVVILWIVQTVKSKCKKAILQHIQQKRSHMLQLGVVLVVSMQNPVNMMFQNEPTLDMMRNLCHEPQIGQCQK